MPEYTPSCGGWCSFHETGEAATGARYSSAFGTTRLHQTAKRFPIPTPPYGSAPTVCPAEPC